MRFIETGGESGCYRDGEQQARMEKRVAGGQERTSLVVQDRRRRSSGNLTIYLKNTSKKLVITFI